MYNNGKVTAPVNTDDVNMATGENSHDFGTLCRSPKQNMWAKFHAYQLNRPEPYNNAERKAIQWGLDVPVYAITQVPSPMPPKWSHVRPDMTSYYPTAVFVGENPGEGYVHDAPALFSVNMSKSGTFLKVFFTFNQDASNGGITAPEMIINALGGVAMENLYPGIIIYEYNNGWVPKHIGTTDKKIGSNKSMSADYPLSYMGTGSFAVLPIFSPTAYVLRAIAGLGTVNVLHGHDYKSELDLTDPNVGTWLLTRGYVSNKYFSYSGLTPLDTALSSADESIYYWRFISTSRLVLTAQNEYKIIANDDRRIVVTLGAKDNNGDYGLWNYCPVEHQAGYTAGLSYATYNSLCKDYGYELCRFYGDADNEPLYLMLRYVAIKNDSSYSSHSSETKWSMGFNRVLVLIDDQGNEVWAASTGLIQRIMRNGSTPVVSGTRITKVRFGNVITGNGSHNSATGMFVQLHGADGTIVTGYIGSNTAKIDASDYTLTFNDNVPANLSGKMQRIPTQTDMYIDITVDTLDTVQDIIIR